MKSFLWAVAVTLLVVMLVLAACTAKEKAPAEETPATTTTAPAAPAAPLAIGMKFGERYHEIHTTKLQLKCEFCHTSMTETYYDPLAQVSNLADRRACLSCHKEGAAQPFYGEAWSQAKVK